MRSAAARTRVDYACRAVRAARTVRSPDVERSVLIISTPFRDDDAQEA